jgi:glycosyltransferase-like protein
MSQLVSRPLRIAMLTHSTNPRGGVVHALELGRALQDCGHTVAVHAPDQGGRGFFGAPRCATVRVPAKAASGGLAGLVGQRIDEYVAYFLRADVDSWDILHAQDAISANALIALRERGLIQGFVRTVHHLDQFDDPQLMAWQRRGFAQASRVLCVSRTWCDLLAREHGIQATLVPNGVDQRRYSPEPDDSDARVRRRYGLERGGPVLLAVGGIEARKNTLRLLAAFVQVRNVLPDAQLVIAGGASLLDHASYREGFDAAVRAAGLAVGPGLPLVLTGTAADEDMPALFRCADTLVFPSVREGFGLVVLEAMASGTPVVVSRIAPFTEYLTDQDCVWCDPLDIESIARAIRTACTPAATERLSHAGHAVCRRFSWQTSARCHVEIYSAFIGAGSGARTEGRNARYA